MGGSPERAALVALRDAALELLTLEGDADLPDAAIVAVRAAARHRYADYVARWGPLNRGELREGRVDPHTAEPRLHWRRPGLDGFRTDPDYLTVMALEVYDPATGAAGPAPILLRRVHGHRQPISRVTGAVEAVAVARGEGGAAGFDLDRVAELLGLPGAAAAEQAVGELAFRDPERAGRWSAASDYLAGDVRARLIAARAAAATDESYRRNEVALSAVVPPDLGPLDIAVSLGSPWVAAQDIEAFVRDEWGGRVRVWRLPSAAWWKIVPTGRLPANRYGTARLSAYEILSAGLNGRSPMVIDSEAGPVPGHRVRRRNARESLAAQERLGEIEERFRSWLWEDAQRADRLCAEYNRRFNSHVAPAFHGAQFSFPGLADGVELWPWQRDVIARIVSSPATLCAHAVGAGKTLSMVGAAMTARRLGLARKPLITVPAHLVEQVAREARQAYPQGRFLVAGEGVAGKGVAGEGVAGETRLGRAVAARCATGDWDAVIVSHGAFSALPVAPAAELGWVGSRIATAEAELRGGRGGRHGRGVLRRRLATLQARADELAQTPPPSITFESLGVDLLLVDEAHYFKRLPVTTRREGISLGSSRRAADLLLKARILRTRRGSLPSLALFTGTPWSNTIAETFVWQTFVQPELLAAAGIEHFDAWAAVFVEYADVVEVTPDSAGIRVTQRPSRVRNLPELQRMLAVSSVVLPADALGLERPDRVDDTVVCRPGPAQRDYVHSLAVRADKIRREKVRGGPGEDNMLALCGDGRRAALDPRLVGVAEDSTKVAAIADRVAQIHHAHAGLRFAGSDEPGAFQIVFCDQGTPGVDGPQTYGRLRIALASRGVAAEKVRWVHEARTPAGRAALFASCRAGAVSVLIGSTDTLGTGCNVQTRLRAIHHADAPWRPSDIEQREGRALRPGNLNPVVDVVRYVTRGTFDGYMWQTLERKVRFTTDLQRGDVSGRTADDLGDTVLSFAEVKALATGNALLLEQAQAAADVARLRVLRSLAAQTRTAARADLARAEQERYRHQQQERMLCSAAARLAEQVGGGTELPAAIEALRLRLRVPDPAAAPAPIRAPWHGLGVELIPVGGWPAPDPTAVVVRVTLAHRVVDELQVPVRGVRRAPGLVLRTLAEWRARLDTRITEVAAAAVQAHEDAVRAADTLEHQPFDRAAELGTAEARLRLIEIALEASVDDRGPSDTSDAEVA